MNNEQLVKLPPVAVCTVCSNYTHRIELANEQCHERYAKNRCKGVYQSAISVGDWATCPSCHSIGCEACQRSGFVFVRKRQQGTSKIGGRPDDKVNAAIMNAYIKGGAIQHMQPVILQHQTKVTGWIAPRPGRHVTGIADHFKNGGVILCHGYFPKMSGRISSRGYKESIISVSLNP